VGEDAEFQIRILVEDFAVLVVIGAEVLGDEIGVGAGAFGVLPAELAAGGAGVLHQRGAAVGGELLERVGHGVASGRIGVGASLGQGRARRQPVGHGCDAVPSASCALTVCRRGRLMIAPRRSLR
jgi:hypothetical protein